MSWDIDDNTVFCPMANRNGENLWTLAKEFLAFVNQARADWKLIFWSSRTLSNIQTKLSCGNPQVHYWKATQQLWYGHLYSLFHFCQGNVGWQTLPRYPIKNFLMAHKFEFKDKILLQYYIWIFIFGYLDLISAEADKYVVSPTRCKRAWPV